MNGDQYNQVTEVERIRTLAMDLFEATNRRDIFGMVNYARLICARTKTLIESLEARNLERGGS